MAKELLQDLAARALAARQYTHALDGGPSFQVRLPTSHQLQVESQRVGLGSLADPAALLVLQRRLLLTGIHGWGGVLQNHLVDQASPDPLDFHPDAVEPLLDAQPEWEAALANDLVRRLFERIKARSAAAKN